MKTRKPNNRIEKQIATATIISDEFLRRFQAIYQPQFLKTEFVRVVVGWCMEYFTAYGKAPMEDIEEIWHEKSESLEEAQADLLGKFLDNLSDEYERVDKFNAGYVFDQAVAYLRTRSLRVLREQIDDCLSTGRAEDAEAAVEGYARVHNPSMDQSYDPFTDTELIRRAFEHSEEQLFNVKGALGDMLGPQLKRQGFVAFQGPEKRGKSWVLMELAYQAITQKCNVAFFSTGDMTEEEITERIHVRLAKKSNRKRYCGEVRVPCADCMLNQDGACSRPKRTCDVDLEDSLPIDTEAPDGYEPCTFCRGRSKCYLPAVFYQTQYIEEPLTWREGVKRGRRFDRLRKKKHMRLKFFPNSTMTVGDMEQQLNQWATFEGFVPDVIVVDYADIMDKEPGEADFRQKENERWKKLRSLNQRWNVCFITATQADAKSYKASRQTMDNFSEDKRKYGHVTAFYALNQTEQEKARGLMRVGTLALRADDFNPLKEVTLLTCLSKGQIHVDSLFIPNKQS